MEFRKQRNNEILECDDFYISYNPATDDESYPEGALANLLGNMVGLPNKGPETALCIDGEFYILKGDWRQEYALIAPQGKEACLDFYIAHMAEHNSPWSDSLPRPALHS